MLKAIADFIPALFKRIFWIMSGHDENKQKRLVLLVLLCLALPLACLEGWNLYSRAKWQSANPHAYPMAAPAVK